MTANDYLPPSFSSAFCSSILFNSIDKDVRLLIHDSSLLTANARETLEAEFNQRLALNSSDVLSARCNRFNIPGTHPADYLERDVVVSKGRSALAGIRFKNLQRDQPFIDVWPGWPLASSADFSELLNSIRNEFEAFAPKSISLWLSGERIHALQDTACNPNFGQVVVGAMREAILSHTQQRSPDGDVANRNGVRLQAISSMEFFDRYAAAYEEFHLKEPFLRNKVPKTSREDLERSVAQGLAFHLLVDGEEAGLIAGERRSYVGLPGIYFLELFLYEKFRGQRLAPIMQRLFVDCANKDSEAFIWGTIDMQNQPSLRTALRLGRTIVSREVFLPLT